MRTIGFVPAFDGVRAVAVMLIVIIHLTGTFIPSQRELFMPGGFLGVDIFFVLSGFLITSVLLREFERWGRIRMGRFYLGRVLRLVPAVAALFLVQFLWARAIGIPPSRDLPALYQAVFSTSTWGWHFLLVPGSSLVNYPPGLGQFWSLVVEEQFYFVWPAILFAALTFGRTRKVALVVTGLMIVIILGHRIADLNATLGWAVEYGRVDYRADSLLIGAFAAQLWLAGWVPAARIIKAGAWAGVGLLAFGVLYLHSSSRLLYRGGYDVIAIGVAFGLLALVGDGLVGGPAARAAPPAGAGNGVLRLLHLAPAGLRHHPLLRHPRPMEHMVGDGAGRAVGRGRHRAVVVPGRAAVPAAQGPPATHRHRARHQFRHRVALCDLRGVSLALAL